MTDIKNIQDKVNSVFIDSFGTTPLGQRLDDILGEAIELKRWTHLPNLKEEAGDLMSSLLQLFNECEWDAEQCVQATLDKIERRKMQYKSLGRKISVAIFGGAFDPPTIGHIQAAEFVLNTSSVFDEVWLMPCYKSLHGKKMSSPEDRLKMCELATADYGRIKVWDYEIANKFGGSTYQFVKQLFDEDFAKDKYDFSFIIGMDNAIHFDKWLNQEHLEKMLRFVVLPRKGVDYVPSFKDWFMKSPHIFLASDNIPICEISSTKIRNVFKSCSFQNIKIDTARKYMNQNVIDYILENDLYRKGE